MVFCRLIFTIDIPLKKELGFRDLAVMTTRKSYASLNKRIRGVVPQNHLLAKVHRIDIPSIDTVGVGLQEVVKPLSMDHKEKSSEAKNCFFMNINLHDCGLTLEPFLSLEVKKIDYNGTSMKSEQIGSLRLLVLARKDYIYLRRERSFVDKMIIPCFAIKRIYFDSDSSFLLVLNKDFGYWKVKLMSTHYKLMNFFTERKDEWINDDIHSVSTERLKQLRGHERRKREHSYKDPVTIDHSSPLCSQIESSSTASDDILRNGLPSELLPEKKSRKLKTLPTQNSTSTVARLTRSLRNPFIQMSLPDDTVDLDSSDTALDFDVEEADDVHETPAPFEPPLRYSVNASKSFTITANDFKTLYNASWVNDTLIDFFIAYEIERGISELHTIIRSQIYAFNSFFYTKLVSTAGNEEPQYYENIRKWLEKLDLSCFEHIVIPIMENAHWFCMVIKGLPNLVAHAKTQANAEEVASDIEEVKLEGSCSSPKRSRTKGSKKTLAEIFVVDSLRLTHPNLIGPIKTVLREHCREKHGITIDTDLITLRTSKVPRQRNTSDCGIHVIYNLKKWLSEPEKCEQMWRKSSTTNRAYFNGQERNTMRRWCINVLLSLHSQQPTPEESKDGLDEGEPHSEDDIEEISYVHSKLAEASEPTTEVLSNPIVENENAFNQVKAAPKNHAEQENEILAALDTLLKAPLPPESQLSQISESQDSDFSKLILSQFLDNSNHENTSLDVVRADPSSLEELPLAESERNDETGFETKPLYYHKTLDPRVPTANRTSERQFDKKYRFVQIEHPQLRKLCLGLKLSQGTMHYLNQVLQKHEKVYEPDHLKALVELTKIYEECNQMRDAAGLDVIEQQFSAILKEPAAPMDAPFVIDEADESRELNRSVGDLRLVDEDYSSIEAKTPPLRSNSSESLQIQLHRKVSAPDNKSRKSSHDLDTFEEVVDANVLNPPPNRRVTREETRLKEIEMRKNKLKVQVLSDSDEESHSTIARVKEKQYDWSSPKRRRLDRSP